jgi:hypothetical protein
MIKSFKDFDFELKGQKIYEALDDNIKNSFTEDDVFVPEMISDNKFLLKISKIVLKRLNASGFGKFGVYPMIVNIDSVSGVYFYNYDNPSMNIVICRNTHGKHVYLFKEFVLGGENIADLVLSTTKLGFSDIIDVLISKLDPSTIEEGLICEWAEGGAAPTFPYDDRITKVASTLSAVVRNEILKVFLGVKSMPSYNAACKEIWNGYTSGEEPYVEICKEIESIIGGGKKITAGGYFKQVINVFMTAAKGISEHGDEMEALFKDTEYTYNATFTIKKDVRAEVTDTESGVRSEVYMKQLERSTIEYEEDLEEIYDIAVAMCKYVKQGGVLDRNDRSALESRGMIITGPGGIGKTESIKRALEDLKMQPDKDYFEVVNGSTAPSELYKRLYDYNGKLLIFDDTAALFDTEYKLALWKNALQGEPERSRISVSTKTGGKSADSSVYILKNQTRQERYFLEVGHSTPKEEKEFREAKKQELDKEYREKTGYTGYKLPAIIIKEHEQIIDDAWKEHEETKTPKMPSHFNYKGVVIIISNKTVDAFKTEVGGDSQWSAINSRFSCFNLDPMPEAIWRVIKKKILEQRDMPETDLPDDMCLIPRDVVDEFIAEVESYLDEPEYRKMNFRLVADSMHTNFQGEYGRKRWKKRLRRLMDTKR